MGFKVYLRWPNSRVSHKTSTPSREVAEAAFAELLAMGELQGQEVGASFTEDGQNIAYFDFKSKTLDRKEARLEDNRGNR